MCHSNNIKVAIHSKIWLFLLYDVCAVLFSHSSAEGGKFLCLMFSIQLTQA